MTFKISEEGYAFLDAIAVGESEPVGSPHGDGYNKLFGGSRFHGYEHFPQWSGMHCGGSMTHAAGRYQFEPATWQWVSAAIQAPDFSPESQDEAAWYLAIHDYNRRTHRHLEDDLAAGEASWIVQALNKTWTSINEQFYSRYDKAWDQRHMTPTTPPVKPPTALPTVPSLPESPWERLKRLFG